MKKNRILAILLCLVMIMGGLTGCDSEESDVVVLRISNWEEYIDEGDWDEDEVIELDYGKKKSDEWIHDMNQILNGKEGAPADE